MLITNCWYDMKCLADSAENWSLNVGNEMVKSH